jgi:hypothetical protein
VGSFHKEKEPTAPSALYFCIATNFNNTFKKRKTPLSLQSPILPTFSQVVPPWFSCFLSQFSLFELAVFLSLEKVVCFSRPSKDLGVSCQEPVFEAFVQVILGKEDVFFSESLYLFWVRHVKKLKAYTCFKFATSKIESLYLFQVRHF